MYEAFGGNVKAMPLALALAVAFAVAVAVAVASPAVCQGQPKDNANLRAVLKLRHFRAAAEPCPVCVVPGSSDISSFCFALLTHAHAAAVVVVVVECLVLCVVFFIQFFIRSPREKEREQEIACVYAPPMSAIIH